MNDKIYNKLYNLTKKALKNKEIAVAAVIVKDNKIISSACNKRQKKHDVTAHAEILAIKKAAKKNNDWRLNGYEMYVTLQPCEMCEKVIEESRIDKCFYLIKKTHKTNNEKYKKICYLQTNYTGEIADLFETSFKNLR